MTNVGENELLSSTTFRALRRSLDFLTARERLTAENIANVDTPGFKARALDFKSQLDAIVNPQPPKLVSTDPRHFGGPTKVRLVSTSAQHFPAVGISDEPRPALLDPISARVDGNTVDHRSRDGAAGRDPARIWNIYTFTHVENGIHQDRRQRCPIAKPRNQVR